MKDAMLRHVMLCICFFWLLAYSTLVLVGKTLGVGG